MARRIGIIGSRGAIGGALARRIIRDDPTTELHIFSSDARGATEGGVHHVIDYQDADSISAAAKAAAQRGPFDVIVIATGILHDGQSGVAPEKSLRDLSMAKFEAVFRANTIFPAIAAKHFLPVMHTDRRSVFAVLSARVGSISDNQIGGWYAYRASKAALNMILKNLAIEMGRRHKDLIVLGLHPGTVDSQLSKPFQGGVHHEIFTPDQAAGYLLDVIAKAGPTDSGKCFAWDGQEIMP